MPVSESNILEQDLLSGGRYRVRFNFVFLDSRSFTTGLLTARDEAHVSELLVSKADEYNKSVKQSDAQEAVSLGIQTAYMDATQEDVYFTYLFDGYNNEDVLEAYNIMSKVAPQILELGLTVEQMAALFGETVEMAQAVFDKWAYLDANKAVIIAYGEL